MKNLILSIVLLAIGCEGSKPVTSKVQQSRHAVINGQVETGYPAVGALALATNAGYYGGFCSSTLINANWVLTAAHCIDGAVEQAVELGFIPNNSGRDVDGNGVRDDFAEGWVNFLVGSNSNPTFGLRPQNDATLYQAEAIFVHPNYDGDGQLQSDDIALIRLRTSVAGVTPIPIFRGDLTQNVGDVLTYVGFGTSDPNSMAINSSGIKRRTTLPIHVVGSAGYVSTHNNTGICFGDSGGPGLLSQGGSQYVAGVNSTVSGESPTCLLASNQMRVDAYQSWIDSVMGQPQSCGTASPTCQCEEACTSSGYCDHTRCGELDCLGLAECASGCRNGLCASACYARASGDALQGYIDLGDCASRQCPSGDSFCLQDNCGTQLDFCYGDDAFPSGDGSCGDIYACINGCFDSTCTQNCYNSGTLDAQRAYGEFYDCMFNQCGSLQGQYAAFNECLRTTCGSALNTCMPNEGCELTGGDCGSDRACVLEGWGSTYCRISSEVPPLEGCNAGQVSCTDGYYCRNLGDGPRCYQNCYTNADCGDGQCRPLRGASVDFGQCEVPCADADGDGDCDTTDCAPNNAQAYTGGTEVCGDGVDGNCDGQVDENCEACNDADGDGSCDEQDCDPLRADRSPNLEEVCGDNIDNDCDGTTDESCDTCADADGENCEPASCDDPNDPNCGAPIVFFDTPSDDDSGCVTTGNSPVNLGYASLMLMVCIIGLKRRRQA